MTCEDHSALEGPFIPLTPKGRQQLASLEVQSTNRLITDAEEVRIPAARYGSIRGQALSPHESLALIEELPGER
ncbi:Scr1 family TA system antitoxin-like transcriptional regulator [Streptomyces sp. NPDC058637]|uniref:Scr1 family TA system antitoxin-like transcriptional regulator n=1 Tax=Streptomyces sp. NPDC058637 TaxID=3346569 RepID=UPI00365FD40C